ncbi:hypothetical protein DEO72_LG1g3101 [Vigna unguiculata]|uniref:Uncharacterized protein n=1 Tax=Vigna unguiculata TaxID=3917 RepID=A0A4D6KVY0_VIGUN|nr:hypothetical protein DEO72_LG1g3101 [Vigna unguiculata]
MKIKNQKKTLKVVFFFFFVFVFVFFFSVSYSCRHIQLKVSFIKGTYYGFDFLQNYCDALIMPKRPSIIDYQVASAYKSFSPLEEQYAQGKTVLNDDGGREIHRITIQHQSKYKVWGPQH